MAGLKALVPLDGTHLSETAFALLPAVQRLGVDEVVLVSVWEEMWDTREDLPGRDQGELEEVAERGRSYLEAYLQDQCEVVRGYDLRARFDVRMGRAAEEILEAVEEHDADLILIATHGRSGIERWRLGSVADKVIRGAACPTLVIGPNVKTELEPFAMRTVLAPVDGSELSEQVLPVVGWIADVFGAEIELVRVVSMTPVAVDQTMGVYPVDLLSAMEDAANSYLKRLEGQLNGGGRRVRSTLLIGSPPAQLLEYMQHHPVSLVVMATRGRGGVLRAALGSVTDRMLHGPAPVLVFRPDEDSHNRLLEAARRSKTEQGP